MDWRLPASPSLLGVAAGILDVLWFLALVVGPVVTVPSALADAERGCGLGVDAAHNAAYAADLHRSGSVTLRDGRFEEQYEQRSAAMLVVQLVAAAAGDLGSDGCDDLAAVLVTRPGGTGVFVTLHALLARGGEPRHADQVLLGDRIRAQSVRIEDGIVKVRLLVRHDREPFAAEPSVAVVRRFALDGGALTPVSAP